MLNAMRDGAQSKIIKFFLFGFLVMAVGGMALMDVGGFFRNGVGTNSVAKIGSESISSLQFDQTLQRVLSQQGMQAREAYEFGMVDQILQGEINQRLLTQSAYEMGIYAGDATVAKQIASLIDPLVKSQPNAQRSDVLKTVLRAQGMTEQGLVDTLRRSMMNTVLQNTIQTSTAIPSRSEALKIYQIQNETRDVDGFILTDSSVKNVDDVQEEVLKAFYEAGKSSRHVIPETRSFTIAILSEKDLKADSALTDEALEKEYQKSIKSYTLPERREIVQAVLGTQADADKVLAAVRDNKQFLKDAVKAVTGKTTAYQDETLFAREGLVKAMADAAFNAKEGDVSGPVQTPLGWHVFIVQKTIPEAARPFAEVKDSIRKELSEGHLSQQLFDTANIVDDRLASGEDIAAIAKEMHMSLTQIGPVGADGSTQDKRDALKDFAKDREDILTTAFELSEGESAPVLELSDGRYAAIHMDTVNERSFKSYESVKDELKKLWTTDQQEAANMERAKKTQQEIAAGTKTLSAAAAELGAKIESFKGLKRTGEPSKALGQDAQNALFDAVDGETIVTRVENGYLIATVKATKLPDPAKVTDKDLEKLTGALEDAAGTEFMQAYLQHLQDKKKVRINRHLLSTMYGPESGNPL